jgi:hypothetical protein
MRGKPPVMAATVGVELMTVIVLDVAHADVAEYIILVVPGATPVTTPDASTVATEVLLLLHTPPADGVPDNALTDPTHTLSLEL